MATAVSLRTVFTSSTSGLVSGANTAGNAMKKVQKDMAGMRGSLATLKTIAIGQVFAQLSGAAISAGRSLISFGQSTAQGIDVISKLSRRLGLTYGQLSGLKLAGDLAGVGLETIAMGATKLDVAFVAASAGGKEAGAAIAKFTSLGLSMKELEQMSPDERFAAIADAIARLPTAAQRSAAAIRLFGKSGAELLPLFEEGAGAIKKATDMATKFGLTLNNAQGAGVEKMNDSFTTAFAAIQGLATQVVSNLAEPISRIIDDFTNFVAASGGVDIGASISNAMLDGAIFVVEMFGVAANIFAEHVVDPLGSAAATLMAAFNVGSSVAQIFIGVAEFLSFIVQGLGMVLNLIYSGLQKLSSMIEGFLGWTDASEKNSKAADDSFRAAQAQSEGMINSFIASGEAFRESVGLGADDAVKQAGNGVADRIIKQIKEGRAAAEDNRKKPDNAAAKINPEVKRQKDQAELQRKQKTAAEKIGNEKDNPLKTFRDSLSILQDALFNEAISQEEFNRRFSVIQDDLIAANQDALDAEAEQGGVSRKMIGAVDATSTAGIAEKFRLMNPDTPGLKEQRQVAADTKRLRELAQAAADGVPVPVQLLPKGA
jgi:hypothetical protein